MIITRYLIKELVNALFAVTLILLFIFLSNQLLRFLGYAASGKLAPAILFHILGFEATVLLSLLLPLGLYLAILLTYSRMDADNELRMMQVYGFSDKKLAKVTGLLALCIAGIVLLLTTWLNPNIAAKKETWMAQNAGAGNSLNTLMPGRFQLSSDDSRVIYVTDLTRDRGQAKDIFIAEEKKIPNSTASIWTVLSASTGYQMTDAHSQDKFVVAVDGYRYEGIPGQNAYKIIQFKKYAVRLPEQTIGSSHQAQEMLSTRELFLRSSLSHDSKASAELQWRFSMPLSVLLLATLAVPLSRLQPRKSRYMQLLPALFVYVVYMELLFVARDWVEQKQAAASLGLWWVHGVFILCTCIFLWMRKK